jgi:hypothetical protein
MLRPIAALGLMLGVRVVFEPGVQLLNATIVKARPFDRYGEVLWCLSTTQDALEAVFEAALIILQRDVVNIPPPDGDAPEGFASGRHGDAESEGEETLPDLGATGQDRNPLRQQVGNRPPDRREFHL